MLFQASPKLREDKVRQYVHTRLGGEYPPFTIYFISPFLAKCP